MTSAEQIHGNNVAIVNNEQIGKRLPSVDGLITTLKRVPIAIFTADCLSIFIFCPDKNVIALLHAGWRGTVKGIVPNALAYLKKEFGVNLKKAKVIFGPYIHPCCYRVRRDPVIKEARAFLKDQRYFRLYCKNIENDLWALDLGGINQYYLERAGIPSDSISDMGICTYEDNRTFSYRREGVNAGRMMSFLMME